MPILTRAPPEERGVEDPTPLVRLRDDLVGSSSEEDALTFRRPGRDFGGLRRLPAACVVVALVSVAALLAWGSTKSTPPAAVDEPVGAVEAATELDGLPSQSSEEDKPEEDINIWGAFKKVPTPLQKIRERMQGKAAAEEEEAADSAEQPLPEEDPKVCTDGWEFAFKTKLSVGMAKGNQTILKSSTGALALTIEAPENKNASLSFQIETFNFGTVKVARPVEADTTYVVTATKTENAVCLDLCESCVTGDAFKCKDQVCTFAPESMPITSFQMKQPGTLSWEEGPIGTAKGFGQTMGSVPVSFVLGNVPFDKLYESMDDWDALIVRLKKTLAGLAGNGVMPVDVALTPASVAPDSKDGTLVQATVMLQEDDKKSFGNACKVQDEIASWARGKDVKATAFNLAVKATCSDMDITGKDIEAVQASVPGQPMACSSYRCRLSGTHIHLPADASCLGGGCESTCCQAAWSDKPLPIKGNASTPTLTTTKGMPVFKSNGTKVAFDCYSEACCKLTGPPGTVPLPRPFPMGLGLEKGKDWDFASHDPASVEDCQEWCAMSGDCTGITYTKGGKCVIFFEGHCMLSGEGGSKWRYSDNACSGEVTCNAIRSAEKPAEESRPAKDWKMPDFSMPTVTATTTGLSSLQEILVDGSMTLTQKSAAWDKAQGEKKNIDKGLVQPINHDGYNFEFKASVSLKLGACLKAQDILTSDFDTITLRTAPQPGDLPRECKAEFKAYLLNGVDQTGGCHVQTSLPLHEGGKYDITINRDFDQCCITAIPAGGLNGKMAQWYKGKGGKLTKHTCSNRTKDLERTDFQMRPVLSLYGARSHAVHTHSVSQSKGGLTMSFKVANVDIDKLIEHNVKHTLMDAIQESVSYQAAVGMHYDEVLVALKGDVAEAEDEQELDAAPTEPVEYSMPEPSPELVESYQEAHKRVETLMDGEAYYSQPDSNGGKNDHHGNTLDYFKAETEEQPQTTEPPIEYTPPPTTTTRKVRSDNAIGLRINGDNRRLDSTTRKVPALQVQITIAGCGTCEKEKAALESPDADLVIKQRVLRALDTAPNAKASAGDVSIMHKSLPGQVTTCKNFMCTPYRVNSQPDLLCHGAFCKATCCQKRTCSQVKCKAPLVNVFKNAKKTCDGEEDCGQTCCELPCKEYRCMGESCPRENSWLLTAKPAEAQDKCCKARSCCNAPIAACISCLKCQTKEAYCMAHLFGFGSGKRRLSDNAAAEPLTLPAPGSLSANDLSGGLPPMTMRSALTPEQIAEDELEAANSITTGGASLDSSAASGQSLRRLADSPASQAKNKYRRLQSAEQTSLLTGMMDKVAKAEAWRQQNKPTADIQDYSSGASSAEEWKKTWKKVILDAKSKHHGLVPGCEGCSASACPYYFESIFLLHRGCERKASSVNTVQVLTDTRHAVSCGDDGLCWVWKICSGTPRQVFFPNRDCPEDTPLFPMYSVSVLYDATFILSAGAADADGQSGMAYIWDWRYGFQKGSLSCGGGAFLSSAEMPAWRQTLVGCATGYTTVWDWDTGATVEVPYCKKSVEEIAAEINGVLIQYKNYHLDGIHRLFAEKAMVAESAFINVVKKVNPNLVKQLNFTKDVYNFFHKNRFGATLALAYIPSNIRFVSGQADGRVIFFNGETGQILMAMTGHQGAVYAVAPSPTKMQALSGGEDGTVRLWCLKTGVQLALFYQPYGGPVRSLAVIPGGQKVVVGSDDGYVRIWDISTGLLLCAINTGGGAVKGLAVNPSNPLGQIITANEDGYARVFNPR